MVLMEIRIQGFGLSWTVATLVALVAGALLAYAALAMARKGDERLAAAMGIAAAIEVVCVVGELLVRGFISRLLRSDEIGGSDPGLTLLDYWTVIRPLLHAAAMALLAWGALVASRSKD